MSELLTKKARAELLKPALAKNILQTLELSECTAFSITGDSKPISVAKDVKVEEQYGRDEVCYELLTEGPGPRLAVVIVSVWNTVGGSPNARVGETKAHYLIVYARC